ncbi:MAG: acyl--CoA ligase [Alphaproteobacteria bacterium]|nr:acyl--CoA ligase [Alphaproteobacteria bacterium]MCB9929296.1 acyl--CoA ligase [Alphaproteobacteria bacterium]
MPRPPATTFEHLQYHAAIQPDRVALILDDGEITYGRFAADAMRFTKALAELGIRGGQVVTIHHPHFYIEWLLTIGCENLGAVSVSDNARNWKQAGYLYQHVDVGLTNAAVDDEPPFPYHCLTDDWAYAVLRMDLALAQTQPVTTPDLDALVRITRSSGSTGIPKLIPRTRRNQEAYITECIRIIGLTAATRLVLVGATFHINPILVRCQTCICLGATVHRASDPAKAIDRQIPTHIWMLTGLIEWLVSALPEENRIYPKLSIELAGSALSIPQKTLVTSKLTENILTFMGSNEATFLMKMMDSDNGSVVSGVDLELHDEYGAPVPDGVAGRIAVRTPSMIDGYYKSEEETGKWFRNGWFYTGDAGIMTGPRKVQLLGRADDMVFLGGVKESPLVLEDVLRTGSGVRDAAVVSIKASDGGNLVCVALVLADNADLETVRAEILTRWSIFRARLIITAVNDLPRTENGKVSRAKVRDFFRQQQGIAPATG